MFLCRRHEVRKGQFGHVVGAEHIDVDDALEGVGRELRQRCEEVACCSGTKREKRERRQ